MAAPIAGSISPSLTPRVEGDLGVEVGWGFLYPPPRQLGARAHRQKKYSKNAYHPEGAA